jgi:hypothetical protein
LESTDSALSVDDLVKDINFPNASALNKAVLSDELKYVVDLALTKEFLTETKNTLQQHQYKLWNFNEV